jgi:hypothetical protein
VKIQPQWVVTTGKQANISRVWKTKGTKCGWVFGRDPLVDNAANMRMILKLVLKK